MAERATIAQVVQLGVETTPGTSVAANKKLQATGFGITPTLETRLVRPAGLKYPTIAILGKDYSALGISGDASYEDLFHLLRSVLCEPAKTGTGPWTFTYTPVVNGPDTVKTFTIEKGDTVKAEKVTGVQLNELSLAFSRDAVEVSGSAIGGAVQFGITMTGSPTALPLTPLLPLNVCVYLDPTSAAIGTTKLLRVLNGSWAIGNRFNPLFVLDCAQPSYVALVEATPEVTVELQVEVDNVGDDFVLNYARVGANAYNRIEVNKDANNQFRIDSALTVTGVSEMADADGVYAYTVTMAGVADAAWGTAPGKVCQAVLKTPTDLSL